MIDGGQGVTVCAGCGSDGAGGRRAMVAGIFSWFPEDSDTRDLIAAKVLLDPSYQAPA
jgi:hypothetical protein